MRRGKGKRRDDVGGRVAIPGIAGCSKSGYRKLGGETLWNRPINNSLDQKKSKIHVKV